MPMKSLTLIGAASVALLFPGSVLALDEIVGEWAVDAESCRESRLVFDFEGNHTALVAEEGRWQALGTAAYRREDNLLIITTGEVEERIEIVTQERDRLVLRNRNSPAGDITTELVRCPSY
jgi:hypothetical protein